jgi:hypothetical protein
MSENLIQPFPDLVGVGSLEHLHHAGSPRFQEGGDQSQHRFYKGLGTGGIHGADPRGRGGCIA